MPEEINRIVTDSIVDLLWTPSEDGNENLLQEGVNKSKIQMVGNIMIDSLEMLREKIEIAESWKELGLTEKHYAVITMHRPSNVDQEETLAPIVQALKNLSTRLEVIFPIHPRTRSNLDRFGLMNHPISTPGIHCVTPLNYLRFMNLISN